MPYRVRILPSHRLAVIDLHGEIDGALLIEATMAVIRDPMWTPGYDSLWDARAVSKLLLDIDQANEISRLSERHADVFGTGKGAVVVSRSLDYMLGRMFARTNRNPNRVIRVFRDLDEAMDWIGILEMPGEIDEDSNRGR